ncbi:MAG: UDP-3-O-(3-hydroxymyristoyl)glucosamine N-acyltransferase [Bacteroidales bacterium]|nr:UDP-3-O-(3-hydroxymyristoyl)glucosamine N-acyltransferase [Bacteroidales bacterium]
MKFTAKEIAKLLNGTIEGNSEAEVSKLCKIEEGEPNGISFLANPKYTHYIYETRADIVIVSNDFVAEHPVSATLIRVADPYMAFASLLKAYNDMQNDKQGIASQSFIHPSASFGEQCYVGEFAYIGENVKVGHNVKIYPQVYVGDNCTIGDNTTLFAGVKLYSHTVIGQRCLLHAGCVVGSDGFGFAPTADGSYNKIDQIGNVVVEDDVEIGANTCIDRATMGSTIIHKGVKIDNLCQIAHNVVVGANTAMAAQTGIAGSGKVGSNCIIAGQVGIVGHIEVGDRVVIAAQSGVTRSVESDCTLLGSPAIDASLQRKNYVYSRNMTKLVARIDALEKELKRLKS